MIVIRGTAAFRSRVEGVPLGDGDGDAATGLLGEWFANSKAWRPHVALFVHRTTFLPVVVPLAPADGVLERFGQQLDDVLRALGVPEPAIAAERAERGDVRIAPTDDRTVLGVMNEHVNQLEWRRRERGRLDPDDLLAASVELAGMPVGPLRGHGSFPDRAVVALLGGEAAPARTASRAPGGARRQFLTLRVELVEGRGEAFWPRPGREFVVPRSATFAQLADGIDTAFARWDRAHLHRFLLEDGTQVLHVADWGGDAPDGALDDAARLDRLGPGARFAYEFDLGDGWMHLCSVIEDRTDPRELLGHEPDDPAVVDGWGTVPDQYGRRFAEDDGDAEPPPEPEPPMADLPPLVPSWGPPRRPRTTIAGDVVAMLADLGSRHRSHGWDREAEGALHAATSSGDVDALLRLLLTRGPMEVAHRVGAGLLVALAVATDEAHDLAAQIAGDLAASLRDRFEAGDEVLADQLDDARGAQPLTHLRPAVADLDVLVELLSGEGSGGEGWRLDVATGQWWPADPVGIWGDEEPPHWEDPDRWVSIIGASLDGSRDAWQDMAAFAGELEDGELGERLHDAIQGAGAFRRFRAVLDEEPEEVLHHWLRVRDERRRGRARSWMAQHGWAVVPPPPDRDGPPGDGM